ncbi:MAG: hypothetical protein JKY71_06075 [Alphaproteobacteria bacterium]|nr:hypothetical protein [Alphaproteobacteria bacterium]
MHTLGLAGNYALPGNLQSSLDQYGLRVHHRGERRFEIEGASGPLDLDTLCPASVEHDGNTLDLKGLRQFSEFIHQPVRATLARPYKDEERPKGFRSRVKQVKAHEAQVHEDRTDIHRLLRFAVTGSVEIPPDEEEGLDKETAECHAATEQAMRDEDTWRSEKEFGNSEAKISSIPNTHFDPEQGFIIELNDQDEYAGYHQKKLDETFRNVLNTSTDGRYSERTGTIVLSGDELERFCNAAKEQDIGTLIDNVEFEEGVQDKLKSIEARVQDCLHSPLLDDPRVSKSEQLSQLMTATSALTPIINSEFMRKAWTRYNFTERHASPLEGLNKEISVFMAVANTYLQQDHVTSAQMEALGTEFYSLLSFSDEMMGALDNGLAKQAVKDPANDKIAYQREGIAELRDRFHNASVAGVDLDAKFLSDEQRDALETMQKYAGKPGTVGDKLRGAISAPLEAGGDTFVDFAGDVVNFIREDPKIATAFVTLASVLIYMKGGDPSCTMPMINELGQLVDVPVDCDLIPGDIFGDQPYHWDLKFSPLSGYELYKHFANANFITGPTYQFMDWLQTTMQDAYQLAGFNPDAETAFSAGAEKVVEPLADKLFAVNMFQNVSHAAFWMWAFSRGYEHGPRGFGKLFELAGPVTDLAVQAGSSVAETVSRKPKTPLSEHLAALSSGDEIKPKYEGDFQPVQAEQIAEKLAKAAEVKAAIEGDLPIEVEPYNGTLVIDQLKKPKLDGLRREFTISSENLRPTLKALHKFDHMMQHVGEHLMANEKWHVEPLLDATDEVIAALNDYRKHGDAETLTKALDQHAEYILASELRYRGGTSEIYEALFEAAPDKDAFKRLMRSANTTIGKEKRHNAKQEARAAMRGEGKEPLKLTGHLAAKGKIAATNLWGGMVSSAKTLRRGTDHVFTKRNAIIGAGVAAACVGLDMGGAGNEFTDAVSGVTGGGIAGSTTIATFLNFNFWEDIVGVHIGTGIGLLFSGAAAGFGYKRGIKPALMSGLETKPGQVIQHSYQHVADRVGAAVDYVGDKLDEKNTAWGRALTEKAARNQSMAFEIGR